LRAAVLHLFRFWKQPRYEAEENNVATSSNNGNRKSGKRTSGGSSKSSLPRFESMPGGLSDTRRAPKASSKQTLPWENEAKRLSSSLPKEDFRSIPGTSAGTSKTSRRSGSGASSRSGQDASRKTASRRTARSRRETAPVDDEISTSRRAASANWDDVRPKTRDSKILNFIGAHTKLVVALVIVIAVGTLIYPAAREYYISTRNLEKANIELAEVNERNQEIQHDIDRLTTDEGKEDYVRERYGWVKEGEHAVIVKGVPSDASTTVVEEEVATEDIKPESSWLTNVLDVIFLVGE